MVKKVYGVIGNPIEHSLSPVMHNAAFEALGLDAIYLAFKVAEHDLGDAIRGAKSLGIAGLNVTIPLKEKALAFVEADDIASRIGAINTIDFTSGTPTGYNTDGIGALTVLKERVGEIRGKEVLILGAGGAARAIAFYLDTEGARLTIANRTEDRAAMLASSLHNADFISLSEEELKRHIKDADILINTTSVGMYPRADATLVNAGMMHSRLVVFDIVYNPAETKLLREAKKAGVQTIIEGVKMLVYQGAASFRIWTGMEPPVEVMEAAVRKALSLS
ncbi:MAG: shikimate dehydrogenase [Methanophagales archaeon]|nr:shikimate dehydrogenase [Methanophagales archaeon]MCW3139032.1 shikimate dehydrogenase [Methanophagales archaeon]MCW7069460.1 shikimate dehydrogenase [Methanophagales archaeon]MCW7072737.1 shikimate dehydrogenase [Methanophagales archaeon]